MDQAKIIATLTELATTWGLKIVGVLVVLFIGWLFAGWVRNTLIRAFKKRSFDATLAKFFANLARYAVLAGIIIGCMGVFGIQTTSFAAVIASAGLAIGLAFQGTLGNFAAGIMLLVFRPFKVGDLIKSAGQVGVVQEIELFTTSLTTPDNRYIIVPNTKIFGDTIENMSHFDNRRVDINVGVDYTASIDEVRKVLLAAGKGVDGVLDEPGVTAFLAELGDSAVVWQLRVWCHPDDYWDVFQAAMRATKIALDDAGIGIPYPQMDVHLDQAN